MSYRHQLLQAYLNAGSLFPESLKCDNAIPFSKDIYNTLIQSAIDECPNLLEKTLQCSRGIEVYGTLYEADMYVLVTITAESDLVLTLGKILLILIDKEDGDIYHIVTLHDAELISELGIYVLRTTHGPTESTCIPHNTLLDFAPLSGYNYKGKIAVALKTQICDV
ncbi:hypothetical protein HOLleu_17169 [Holothuria leucospilota]|nr:hypothetical protein HOLleu_17169 [Holothuria leucospilota]